MVRLFSNGSDKAPVPSGDEAKKAKKNEEFMMGALKTGAIVVASLVFIFFILPNAEDWIRGLDKPRGGGVYTGSYISTRDAPRPTAQAPVPAADYPTSIPSVVYASELRNYPTVTEEAVNRFFDLLEERGPRHVQWFKDNPRQAFIIIAALQEGGGLTLDQALDRYAPGYLSIEIDNGK